MHKTASAKMAAAKAPAAKIPDKLYFRIGEVAKLCGVQAYVLRFWESEFTALRPNKSGTGQRLYRRRDVEMALRVRHLLYEEGYTIPGARQALKLETKPASKIAEENNSQQPLQFAAATRSPAEVKIEQLRGDLRSLLVQLSGPPSGSVHAINSDRQGSSRSRRERHQDMALFER